MPAMDGLTDTSQGLPSVAWVAWIAWVVLGYLAGSIPFGLLIGRLRGVDIRRAGSGNVGATNVGRLLGRRWGVACFVLDVLKGAAPVLLAGWGMGLLGRVDIAAGEAWWWLAVGAAAVLGHVFPVWLKFRGGKGVATSFGVLLGLWPLMTLPGLAALATWLVVAAATRYVSLASIIAAVGLPVYLYLIWGLGRGRSLHELLPLLLVAAALALLVIVRHCGNIARLLAGTESKIGGGKPA